jgi:hypothetical protein
VPTKCHRPHQWVLNFTTTTVPRIDRSHGAQLAHHQWVASSQAQRRTHAFWLCLPGQSRDADAGINNNESGDRAAEIQDCASCLASAVPKLTISHFMYQSVPRNKVRICPVQVVGNTIMGSSMDPAILIQSPNCFIYIYMSTTHKQFFLRKFRFPHLLK